MPAYQLEKCPAPDLLASVVMRLPCKPVIRYLVAMPRGEISQFWVGRTALVGYVGRQDTWPVS